MYILYWDCWEPCKLGHVVRKWWAVCLAAPHSQAGEVRRPILNMLCLNLTWPVQTRLSRVHSFRDNQYPGGRLLGTSMKSLRLLFEDCQRPAHWRWLQLLESELSVDRRFCIWMLEVDKNMTIVCADLDYLYGRRKFPKMSHSLQENPLSKT